MGDLQFFALQCPICGEDLDAFMPQSIPVAKLKAVIDKVIDRQLAIEEVSMNRDTRAGRRIELSYFLVALTALLPKEATE